MPVSAQSKQVVQALFDACGEAAEVPEEDFIDYCVGMTGSGAAFPALLAQAMEIHAVAQGLPADFARRAALGVVAASQLLAAPGSNPATVRAIPNAAASLGQSFTPVIALLALGIGYATKFVEKDTFVHWGIGIIIAGSAAQLTALFFT